MTVETRVHCRNSSNPYHVCGSEYCSKATHFEANKFTTQIRQDCRNSSNPYHVCGSEYCSKGTAEAKKFATNIDPDCRNSSNPYHECGSEYCPKGIAEAQKLATKVRPGLKAETRSSRRTSVATSVQTELPYNENREPDDHSSIVDNIDPEDQPQVETTKLTGKQKKLYELMLEMNEATKADQSAMVAEKERMESPQESRGVSEQKWMDEGLLHDIIEDQRIAKADRELILQRQEYQDAMLQWLVESQRIMATEAGITLPPAPHRDQLTPQQDPQSC